VPLVVQRFIGDEAAPELRPASGPVEVARRDWTLVYIGAALGGLAALAALAWFLSRRLRRRERHAGHAETVRRAPAHEEALARLQKLESSGALDADDRKPAYFEMSEILRDYLGRRYQFPGLDYTTEEVNGALAARPEASPIADDVARWLTDADFVKFADYPATADEARAALYKVRQLVHETMPRAESPEAQHG